MAKDLVHCPLLLAVELEPESAASVPAATLALESAAALVDAVAADLARLVPGVERLGLALAGALFDPAQVLRPGWPVFAELAGLYAREARGRGFVPQLIGFGASAGRMADAALEPEPALVGGALRVVPLVLIGPAADAQDVGARLETVLEHAGLAGAATALFLNRSLSLRVAHARYLTHHDLAALTAIQLEHAALGVAWPLIECALLSPRRMETVHAAPGLTLVYADGGVRATTQGYRAFGRLAGVPAVAAARAAAYCAARRLERQLAALLAAHGLPVARLRLDAPPTDAAALQAALERAPPVEAGVVETLHDAAPDGAVRLFTHVDATLGVVALSAGVRDGSRWRALAHAYPSDQAGHDALRRELATRYAVAAPPQRLDGLALSADAATLLCEGS